MAALAIDGPDTMIVSSLGASPATDGLDTILVSGARLMLIAVMQLVKVSTERCTGHRMRHGPCRLQVACRKTIVMNTAVT